VTNKIRQQGNKAVFCSSGNRSDLSNYLKKNQTNHKSKELPGSASARERNETKQNQNKPVPLELILLLASL
jgi:hypothetical protein